MAKSGWKIVLLYHAKQKGSLDMLVQSLDFIDHHVALFDSTDAKYK